MRCDEAASDNVNNYVVTCVAAGTKDSAQENPTTDSLADDFETTFPRIIQPTETERSHHSPQVTMSNAINLACRKMT